MDRTVIIRFDARTLIWVGVLLVMLAVWLPWTSLPSFVVGDLAQRGVEAGGLFTFAFAALAAVSLLLPWRPWRRVSMPAAILAVLIDLVALAAFARVIQYAAVLEMDLGVQLSSVGNGLYMTFAGSWLMLFGGLAEGAPGDTPTWDLGWMGYAAWAALVVAMLAACLCAWSIGLIVRPYTIDTGPRQVATFGPAPTAYLATPLVDVQLEPLGNANPASTLAPALIRTATVKPIPTFTPVKAATNTPPAIPPSPTVRTFTLTITPLPSSTQPVSTVTSSTAPTPTGTPTSTSTSTPTGALTATTTRTPTPPTSSVATPTPPTSSVATPTTTSTSP